MNQGPLPKVICFYAHELKDGPLTPPPAPAESRGVPGVWMPMNAIPCGDKFLVMQWGWVQEEGVVARVIHQ